MGMHELIFKTSVWCVIFSPLIPLAIGKAKSIKFRIDWLAFALAGLLAAYAWILEFAVDETSINVIVRLGIISLLIFFFALALGRPANSKALLGVKRSEVIGFIIKSFQALAVIIWFREQAYWFKLKAIEFNFTLGGSLAYPGEKTIWETAREHYVESIVFALVAFCIVLLPILICRKNPITIIVDAWTWAVGIIAGIAQAICSGMGTGLAAFLWFRANGYNELILIQDCAYVLYALVLARFYRKELGGSRLAVAGEYLARVALFIPLLFVMRQILSGLYFFLWLTFFNLTV
jgi:hypothetical protein